MVEFHQLAGEMMTDERVQVGSRGELRAWLQANHPRGESIWLVTY